MYMVQRRQANLPHPMVSPPHPGEGSLWCGFPP